MKKALPILSLVLVTLFAGTAAVAQSVRDDFNRAATTDISGSLKWRRVLDLTDTSASFQINSDSTISPYNPVGLYSRGAVYWDSLVTPPFEVGIIMRHKSGDTNIPAFYIEVMDDSSWYTGDGYGIRFQDNPGQDRVDIQRIGGSGVDTPITSLMASLNREFFDGDTLFFRFYPDGRKTGIYHSSTGEIDSVSTTDMTFNPSSWLIWLQGAVFADPIKMDDFMIGPLPFSITASAGPGGGISPAGIVPVYPGEDQAFVITPDTGFYISDVHVDTVSVGPVSDYTFFNVDSNHSIEAFFDTLGVIAASAGPNGSISPSGPVIVGYGLDQSFTITPDTGYHVDSVVVDGARVDSTASYTFTNVTSDHTIEAYFTINTYLITATAGPNGSILPSGAVGVTHGSDQAFAVTPDPGYHTDSIVVDGVRVDSLTGYTFSGVTAPHTIEVFFSINVYTITAGATAGGSITPTGPVQVTHGSSQAFSVTPNIGYHIDSIVVDGVRTDSTTSYTFTNVTSNHSILAFFSINAYTITASAGPNGSITPSGVVGINYGGSQSFAVVPDTGYHVDSMLVDGLRVDSTTGYTFTNVTASHTIEVYFSINTYTITASAGPNGMITPEGTVGINYGGSQAFSITASAGYHIDSVLVDGGKVDSTSSYTFSNVTASHTIETFFSINVYIITAGASAGGTITPSGAIGVNHGGNRSFVLTPDPNHHLDSLIVDGVRVDSIAGYTFYNVTSGHTIQAYFSIDVYTITAAAGTNGTITPSGNVGVAHGSDRTFTVSPDTGYHIDSVLVDGIKVDSTRSYTFVNITTDHTIQAFFSINIYRIIATAGVHGSINPSGEFYLPHGSTQAFTITPEAGYHVDSVLVNGIRSDSTASLTLVNIGSDQTVFVYFSINKYTITATAGPNGSITPSGAVTVNHNASRFFSITPDTGYHVDSVVVDGIRVDSTTTYTFTFVTANHTIAAYFSINTFTINATTIGQGTITPSGAVAVYYGGNRTFTVEPDTGYQLDSILVDGVRVDSTASYTFYNIKTNHAITAYFTIKSFSISTMAGPNGTVTPSGTSIVNYGDSLRVTILPNLGYYIADVLVDNVSQGAINSYTFRNVTAGHFLQAFFSTNAPPTPPRLVSPVNGDTILSGLLGSVRFSWLASADSDPGDILTYAVRIFGSGVNFSAGGISDTAAILDLRGVLSAGNEYRWNVRVDDGTASIASPDTFTFRVNPSTGIVNPGIIPTDYALEQNYPNPFNPVTTIRFDLPQRSAITLGVFNILGIEVRRIVDDDAAAAGSYRWTVDFSDIPSGTYLLRMIALGEDGVRFIRTKKMVLLK